MFQAGSFAGTLSQAITGVLLARLLQPELFGIYALAFGVAGLAGIFLGGGTQDAMSAVVGETYAQKDLPATHEGLAYLVKVSVFASILALVIAAWAPLITQLLYGNSEIGWYVLIIILAAAISTLFFSVTSVGLQISGQIKKLSFLVMIDQILRFGLSLLFVFMGGGVLGAVAGHLAGSVIIFLICIFFWRNLRARSSMFPGLVKLLKEIRSVSVTRYLGFSFWTTVDRNISTLYASLPVLLTGIFLAPSQVSFFKLAFGYINIALSVLGPISILLNVEFPKMKVSDTQRLAFNFRKVTYYSIGLSFILTAGAILISPFAFHILYGPSFQMSVPYVFGLAIYGAFFGVGVGLGPMWRAVNRVKTSILINLVTLGIGIPLGLYLIKEFGLRGSTITVTLWYTISHFISFFYLRSLLSRLPREQ